MSETPESAPACAELPPIALSTCWCSHRYPDGYSMVRDMVALGFGRIELSHGIKVTLVEGILRAVQQGIVEVVSCHNFCPLPPGITTAAPNLYVPSSRDPRERGQWVRHTRKSIDFAAQVGSRRLVLHLGRAEFFWFNPADRVKKASRGRTREELLADPAYARTLEAAQAKLGETSDAYWENTRLALAEVVPYAAEKGIVLLCENRERMDELPLDGRVAEFLEGLGDAASHFGYWHDTGHATIKHQAGVIDHARHLERLGAHLHGFHLHDVAEGRDHQAIGTGVCDWSVVYRAIRPHHTLVIEPSPRLTPEQILASRDYLLALHANRGVPPAAVGGGGAEG